MNSIKLSEIRESKRECVNHSMAGSCRGTTLVELLAATAIIAVLIALLLPVIQRKREEYAADKAAQNLAALVEAANTYLMQSGSYPVNLQSLIQFCGATPGACSLDPALATGRLDGYIYMVVDASDFSVWKMVAEPEFPGVTGSITHTYDSDLGRIISNPTPGSNEARQRAFNNILLSGARSVVALLGLDSTRQATAQVRAYTGTTTINAGALATAFGTVDSNHDGQVSLDECAEFSNTTLDDSVRAATSAFTAAINRELRLDTLDDQARQDITATMAELDTTQPSLFSYEGLQSLTMVVVNGGAGDDMLAAKLRAAQNAEASGNLNRKLKALNQYRKRVNSLIGTSVTRANASTLLALVATL